MSVAERMRERLAELDPIVLQIEDDSARHAGHAGARGGGHYNLTIVSDRFGGLGTVARHRLIYAALGEMMRGEVHALAIRALTAAEASIQLNPKESR